MSKFPQKMATGQPLVVVVLCLTLLAWILQMAGGQPLDWLAAGMVRPFLGAQAFVESRMAWFWRGFGDSRDENERLQERLAATELELSVTRSELAAVQALSKTFRLPPPPEWSYLPAQVLARDLAAFDRRFRIGVGSRQGVVPGNVVLADGAVAGRVVQCTANTSLVLSLLDPACKMGVGMENSQAVGLLEGEALDHQGRRTGMIEVSYLPRDIVFHAGDILTTAGFGVEVPGGLMVGELVADEQGQIAPLSENLYRRARLKPMAAHYHQTKVVVLVRQK